MLLLIDTAGGRDATLVVGLVIFAALVAGGVLLLYLLARLNRQTEELRGLDRLDGIEGLLRQIAERGSDLDLRRLEHVLIDIREGQRRLEERLLQMLEAPPTGDDEPSLDMPRPAALGERVTTRLLAMGFERIEVLTPLEDLEALQATGEGEVVVEARRSGVLHKGRVLLREGAISDVKLRDSYEAFP